MGWTVYSCRAAVCLVALTVTVSPASAQGVSVELGFDTLPSAQGWEYSRGCWLPPSPGLDESDVFSLATENGVNVLAVDSYFSYHTCPNYYLDGLVDPELPFTLTVRARILAYYNTPSSPCGLGFVVNVGHEQHDICLGPGATDIYIETGRHVTVPDGFSIYDWHDYTLKGEQGMGYEIWIDGAYLDRTDAPFVDPSVDLYRLSFGDGASGADVEAQISSLVFEQIPPNDPPDCSAAGPSVAVLWPPNHRLMKVNVEGVTDPDGDTVVVTIVGIHQDELVDDVGDGAFAPDGSGVGSSWAWLRAERAGGGDGRVYHVAFTAEDTSGGACSGVVKVAVPQTNGVAAIDGGPLYDATVR